MATAPERALCAVAFDEAVGRMRLTTRVRSEQIRAEIGNVRMDLGGYEEAKNLYDVLGYLLADVNHKTLVLSHPSEEGSPDED